MLLGSNIGDRQEHLQYGIKKINEAAGKVVKKSSFYETEPWGVTDQDAYLNAAVLIETEFSPEELFRAIKEIEIEEGRTDQRKYAPRTLDIDILFYNQQIVHTKHLVIPHPRLHRRKFALVPMNEIASDFVHPVFRKTIGTLLTNCKDPLYVRLFTKRH